MLQNTNRLVNVPVFMLNENDDGAAQAIGDNAGDGRSDLHAIEIEMTAIGYIIEECVEM